MPTSPQTTSINAPASSINHRTAALRAPLAATTSPAITFYSFSTRMQSAKCCSLYPATCQFQCSASFSSIFSIFVARAALRDTNLNSACRFISSSVLCFTRCLWRCSTLATWPRPQLQKLSPTFFYYSNSTHHYDELTVINSANSTTQDLFLLSRIDHANSEIYTATFSETVLEARNQLILFLVSIFISITVGICLFTAYFELMKNVNFLTNPIRIYESASKPTNRLKLLTFSLGLIEILIYFCYKFCLLTSRLVTIAFIWYLYQEWLLVIMGVHVLIVYVASFAPRSRKADRRLGVPAQSSKRSKINDHITMFVISLLSVVDLFMNQISEVYHMHRVVLYYALYFAQNIAATALWIYKTMLHNFSTSTKSSSHASFQVDHLDRTGTDVQTANNFIFGNNSSTFLFNLHSFYAILIFLSIVFLTGFGLVLKLLHLHILKQRFKNLRRISIV